VSVSSEDHAQFCFLVWALLLRIPGSVEHELFEEVDREARRLQGLGMRKLNDSAMLVDDISESISC
jgi:hypothetical protein